MTIKAYAIHTVVLRDENNVKQSVQASTRARPSIFDISKEKFDELEKAGAARRPTKEELAIAQVQGEIDDVDTSTNAEKIIAAEEAKPPLSGSDNDPQGAPKSSRRSSTKEDEI